VVDETLAVPFLPLMGPPGGVPTFPWPACPGRAPCPALTPCPGSVSPPWTGLWGTELDPLGRAEPLLLVGPPLLLEEAGGADEDPGVEDVGGADDAGGEPPRYQLAGSSPKHSPTGTDFSPLPAK